MDQDHLLKVLSYLQQISLNFENTTRSLSPSNIMSFRAQFLIPHCHFKDNSTRAEPTGPLPLYFLPSARRNSKKETHARAEIHLRARKWRSRPFSTNSAASRASSPCGTRNRGNTNRSTTQHPPLSRSRAGCHFSLGHGAGAGAVTQSEPRLSQEAVSLPNKYGLHVKYCLTFLARFVSTQ